MATTGDGESGSAQGATSTTTGSATALPSATGTPTSPSGTSPSTVTGLPEPRTTTEGTSEADSGSGFPVPTDVPAVVTLCSVWDSECPDGEKCVAWSSDASGVWDSARCSPVGPDQLGEPCVILGELASGHDSCALGTMCWGADPETSMGHCAALCHGSENAPVCDDPTTSCVIGNDGSINVCLPTCNPLNQNCPDGEACYGLANDLVCLPPQTPLVSPPDQLFPAFCPPGSTAVLPELDPNCEDDELCCVSWCDLTMLERCPAEMSCEPWFEEGIIWIGGDIGTCLGLP